MRVFCRGRRLLVLTATERRRTKEQRSQRNGVALPMGTLSFHSHFSPAGFPCLAACRLTFEPSAARLSLLAWLLAACTTLETTAREDVLMSYWNRYENKTHTFPKGPVEGITAEGQSIVP